MGCFQDVSEDVACMAVYWEGRKMEFLREAGDEFDRYVAPACWYEPDPAPERIMMVNGLFTEWVLFERPLEGGLTPLEIFIDRRPVAMPKVSWSRLSQVEGSQLFSRFAIRHKDTDTGMCILQDVRTGRRYDVFDEHVCTRDRWRDGTIAERIACVDGEWCPVGQACLYDRAASEDTAEDGPGEVHPEDEGLLPQALLESYYLRLLRDTVGLEGRYTQTLSLPVDAF